MIAFACALALGACGSSNKKPAKSGRGTPIAFSRCMRAHGIAKFPDPSGGGGGGINLAGTGINPASPGFRAAQTACNHLMPGGGISTHATAAGIKQATDFARCMRAHGVSGYPDPIVTATPPAVNPGQYSSAVYGNGIFIGIPKSINANSPTFLKASRACGSP